MQAVPLFGQYRPQLHFMSRQTGVSSLCSLCWIRAQHQTQLTHTLLTHPPCSQLHTNTHSPVPASAAQEVKHLLPPSCLLPGQSQHPLLPRSLLPQRPPSTCHPKMSKLHSTFYSPPSLTMTLEQILSLAPSTH